MSFDSFYKGKTVLITGHTGFKGSWLAAWLKTLGCRVIGFSLPTERGTANLFESASVGKGMISIFGDIRVLPSLVAVLDEHKPDMVFHLAAQSLVRRSYGEPVETFSTNIMGTVNVLETLRQTPSVRAAVFITSDKCYENREWFHAYRECDPMGGYDPYSSSKGCAELVISAYRNSFFRERGMPHVASARAGNVIGGGDWADDRLIPDIVKAVSAGEPVIIRNPEAIRPWQHVLEPLRGYLMLGEQLWKGGDILAEAWNFGPGDGDTTSVRELVERVLQYWGKGELKIQCDSDAVHEAGYLKLDCGKARARLGWRPLLSLNEALEMTVAWYKAYFNNRGSAAIIMDEQIQRYRERPV